MEIESTWLGVRGQEEAMETPGLGGDDINRGRWARNRFGALCRARNVMWLEVELLYGPLDIPVQSAGSRSELKVLIWKSEPRAKMATLCPKLTFLPLPKPVAYGS